MKKKKIFLIILIGIMVSGIVLMYSSYALFSANQISKSAITIKVGTMNGTLKIDGTTTNKLTLDKGKKQTFVVTLENLNSMEGKFLPYYIGELPTGVTFGYMEATGIDIPIETNLSKNGKKTYSIYLENNSSSSVTINLGVQGGLANQPLSLPTNSHMIPQAVGKNKNIANVWKYDQTSGSSTFCVTGEESTCLPINPKTFEPGTIIKYKVNPTTEKYFHVVSDGSDTIILQQRENTLNSISWNSNSDNAKGPLVVLPALENATSNWTNVLDQTYTLGTTVFKNNAYTGCSTYNSCSTNTYTLGQRTGKARMLTIQEASSFGCTYSNQTCPVWMHNYLKDSTNSGGTVNQGNDYGYWTLSVLSSNNAYVFGVNYGGNVTSNYNTNATRGARAVIKVNKYAPIKPSNKNITHVYQYDQTNTSTKCITGEEATCVEISPDTYSPGTIIKYKVNDSLEKYFYVVSDNGNTLTLQQRENTVSATMWYTAKDNTKGPITILPALESATTSWINVLNQTYTLGTTVFKDNPYMGCSYASVTKTFNCTTNPYSIGTKTAKARLLTVQEASSLGCTIDRTSCLVWIYNYLALSASFQGTVNQTLDLAYWLANVYAADTIYSWTIDYTGNIGSSNPNKAQGARAVVLIDK